MKASTSKVIKTSLLPALGLLIGFGMTQPAFSAGGDSDGDSTGAASRSSLPKCKAGLVRDPVFKFRCISKEAAAKKAAKKSKKSKKSSSLDQDTLFNHGRKLAYAGDYEDAILVLKQAPDQGDPRILNMLGFSSRKSGRMDVALNYYRRAVATDPDFSLVREYLGEAFIQLGMLEKAREQLTEIERICGSRVCDEYGQLASLIVKSQIR